MLGAVTTSLKWRHKSSLDKIETNCDTHVNISMIIQHNNWLNRGQILLWGNRGRSN